MEKIRDVLLMQKRELDEFSQKKYVPRSVQLKELNKDIIKVSYRVDNEKTKSREIRSLLHGCKDLGCDHLIVITGGVVWFKGKSSLYPFMEMAA